VSPATATTSANLPLAVACVRVVVALAAAWRGARMQESFGNPIYTLGLSSIFPRHYTARPAGRVYICPRAAAAAGTTRATDAAWCPSS
jgi:hypothetical protein